MSKLLKTDELESRTYQEVIAASALKNNTLVVLPTGLGKTVIAAMVAAKKAEDGKVLFLAPTKPLVEQHVKTFNELLELERADMSIMTGETRPQQRYRLWQQKKIFFATPQVVENDLIADEIPIEEFSLLIFDEAHRASGEYSYNFISDKMPGTHRMALTASPGGDREKIEEVAENLRIDNFEVRTEDHPHVEPYIEDKNIQWTRVSLDDRFEKALEHIEKAYRKQLKKLKSNGHISSVSNVHKGELLELRGKIGSQLSKKDDPSLYQAISQVATALKISQAKEMLETQGVTQCYRYMNKLEGDDSKAAKRALKDENFQKAKNLVQYMKKNGEEHPKLDKVRELIGDMDEDEKAIVFTEYRDSVSVIASELNTEGLNAVKFIGQSGDDGMSQTKQAEVLDAFDNDKFDVMVSTSIGEEGLDIPAVDYVIFYEPVPSGIRDIQRAGRTGRQESGEVVVLIAENTKDEGAYWSAHHKKKRMKNALKELQDNRPEVDEGQKTLQGYDKQEKDAGEKKEEEESKIEIIADDRENSIAKKLSRKDVKVQKKRIEVADFIVSDRTAIERKEASDFVDSIVDQRLFEQLTELRQYDRPVIIIEGDDLYSHRDIHPNAIRGALASIAIDHEIPVMWSEDEDDTAEMLEMMAKREQEEQDRTVAVRGESSSMSEKELQEFVVGGLPNVNTKLAKRLLENFGSIEKVFSASFEELKEVEGIGDKKAADIREIIEKGY
ncbi:MAG: DEAD/DEAH box helicase [Candidatus Nanohaloarchaea archaeon]